MRKLLLGTACWLLATPLQAQTINILMESVPDTRFVQEVLPSSSNRPASTSRSRS